MFLIVISWQQGVRYEIKGRLDIDNHSLTATERLTYYNNSSHNIDTVYFHLYANAYRDAKTYYAREAYKMGNEKYVKAEPGARGYIDVKKVASGDVLLPHNTDGTVMTLPLDQCLEAGDSLVLEIEFHVKVPKGFPGFGFWADHYEMTQWYPKVCVFDGKGWHNEPLHPLECTYGEFGAYEVILDVPGDYVVAGTGEQVDPLETQFLDTLIVTGRKLPRDMRKKVRFLAENVHDFAWVAGASFSVQRHVIGEHSILVYSRVPNTSKARGVARYVEDAFVRYDRWFGEYPYKNMSVVDGFHDGEAVYPQIVVLGFSEDQFTRLFESEIALALGQQWFGGAIGPRMPDDAWLGRGFSTYASIRYMEDKYGSGNTLIKLPFIPPLSLRYFHRFYYYVIQTNQLEKPISTPARDYADIPIAYSNSIGSKPALFLFSLERMIGKENFDRILQRYFQTYRFKHVSSDDLRAIGDEMCDLDLQELFDEILGSIAFCDWRVNDIEGNKVVAENIGGLRIPADLHVVTEQGEQVYALSTDEGLQAVEVHDSLGDIESAAIDPSEYTIDPDYWNNYAPRRISIKPAFDFDWPSFSTYQILWMPYLWYGSYDGIKAGGYVFGDNFADFDFVKGGYQVTAGYTYGFKSKRHYPLLNYQTPVLFTDGKRTRIRFSGSRAEGGDDLSIGLISDLGRPFTRQPQIKIGNMLSYNNLSTLSGLDSIDWDLGRSVVFENDVKFRYRDLVVNAELSVAHHALGSEWEYLKMTIEARRTFSLVVPLSIRLFVGKIFGEAPAQEKLYLSGAMRGSQLTNILFGQAGKYSPQERIHIPGDGNMRGYQTLHIKSDGMYALNIEFPTRTFLRVFTDVGYYDRFAFDVGVRLAVGSETFPFLPLYGLSISANFPLYSYIEGEPWKFRWSLGFSL
ncbi:MAG: M1 family metallopeptidase [candidate division WOR-3 bacterium]